MSKVRKDNQGRNLRKGEYQHKTGVYEYRYTDYNGNKRSVYSWNLVQTDHKSSEKCLRELEDVIVHDTYDNIDTHKARRATVNDVFRMFVEDTNAKNSTMISYKNIYTIYIGPFLGNTLINELKYSDIVSTYKILRSRDLSRATMEFVHNTLVQILDFAVRDSYIRSNPARGLRQAEVSGNARKTISKVALTREQQESFVKYLTNNPRLRRWKNVFVFLLGTGCRVGEVAGLQWSDCDFQNNVIHIRHNLQCLYDTSIGATTLMMCTPKTDSSIRDIPMLPDVKEAILDAMELDRSANGPYVDGYNGFVFRSVRGGALYSTVVNHALRKVVSEHNKCRHVFIQRISAHTLRHTFCTRLCENVSDTNTIKVVQSIMGHATIATTMDVYTSVLDSQKNSAFLELQSKIVLR